MEEQMQEFKEIQFKRTKVQRVYEDDDWVIDLIDGNIKVSYFEGNHFVDDIMITKEYFKDEMTCNQKKIMEDIRSLLKDAISTTLHNKGRIIKLSIYELNELISLIKELTRL